MRIDTSHVDVRTTVERSPWFQRLPQEALDELVSCVKIKTYESQQFLHSIGSKTTSIFCIYSGRVRLSVTSPVGHEFALTDLGPEYWMGEAVLLGDLPRVLDAQAREDSIILEISRTDIERVATANPLMYRNILLWHLMHSRKIYELLGGMLFYPLKSRLAGRLLELVENHGEETDQGILIDKRLSQNDFARLSMGSRQRINKIFRSWNDDGTVIMQGDRYLIVDIEALTQELELSDS